MKRMGSLVLVLGLLLTLAGCGAATKSSDTMIESPGAMEAITQENGSGLVFTTDSAGTQTLSNQKLIKQVNLDAETEDLQALLPQITNHVAQLGGYLESQELYNGSAYSSSRNPNANLTVRIPAERLSEFTAQMEEISNVVNYSETTDDVTLQYVDTESRVKALETEQKRLMELLEQATTLTDVLEIEDRLTEVRYELESYASQMRVLENQVSYATVYLYVRQVKAYTAVEPQSVWQRIGSGFRKNLKNIGQELTDFFVWLITYSPQLIFWALVLVCVVALLRRRTQKRRAKKSVIPPTNPEQNESNP